MPARGTRYLAGATVLAFVIGITLPLASWLVHGISPARPLAEERPAHLRPAWPRDLEELSHYPRAFEDWFGDALGGRETLLGWRSLEYVMLFGMSPTPVVYVGRDQWVFLREGREFEMQRGAAPLGRFELEAWVTAIRARQIWCRSLGAEYVFVLAPDKTSIYPERHALPLFRIGPSRTDQLQAALAGDPVFLDLRASQRRAKERDAPNDHAYYPYGSHWTDRGAAAAMRELGEHVRRLPGAPNWRVLEEQDLDFGPGIQGDTWAFRLYLGDLLVQSEPGIRQILGAQATSGVSRAESGGRERVVTKDDSALAQVVLFHDSFGTAADPFVAYSASRCVSRWEFFEPSVVAAEKPDLVLELFVERILGRPPVENLPEQSELARKLYENAPPQFVMDPGRDVDAFGALGGVEARLDQSSVVIRWLVPTALAELPRGVVPDGAHVVVRLDLETPEPTVANFHFKTGKRTVYSRGDALTRELPSGRSELFLHFTAPDIRGPIAFRINRPIELRLYACEARRVD